ncbi:MAG: peptidase M56, partial [Tannerella sp.]|nr:peptidase M56 [Tannerella sp.]
MGTFFAYSIQSAICLAAFYLFYKVLLSRETFHRFNRIALLGILTLSFLR